MGEIQKTRTEEIVTLHSEIVGHLRSSLEKAMRIGELLTEQKESLKHGEFIPWIKENLPFSERTARNYMRVHHERDRIKTASVADLTSAYKLIAGPVKSSLYDDDILNKVCLFDCYLKNVYGSEEDLKLPLEQRLESWRKWTTRMIGLNIKSGIPWDTICESYYELHPEKYEVSEHKTLKERYKKRPRTWMQVYGIERP